MDALLKLRAPAGGAAVVQGEDHIALLCHVLQEDTAGDEAVGHQLGVRTAIDVYEHRVLLALVHVGRRDEAAPEGVAVFVDDREDLGLAHRTVGIRILGGLQHLHGLALVADQGDDARGGHIGEVVNEIVLAVAEDGVVHTVGGTQTGQHAALEVDLADILVDGLLQRGGEVEVLLFGIQAVDVHDVVAAFRHLLDEVAVHVVHIEMSPAVAVAEVEESSVFEEDDALKRFHIAAVGFLDEHFHLVAALQVVLDQFAVVLGAVEVGDEDVFLVGREGDVGQEFAVGHIGLDVVIDGLALSRRLGHVIDAEGHLVGVAACHGVFHVLHRGNGRAGVDKRIVLHHALVHAVEGDIVAVGGDVLALVDAPLAAVHTLTEGDVFARVGTDEDGLVAVLYALHKDPVVILDDEEFVLHRLVDDLLHIHIGEGVGGETVLADGDQPLVAGEVEGVGIHPLETAYLLDVLFRQLVAGEIEGLLAGLGIDQLDVEVVINVGVVVGAGLPAQPVDSLG